MSSQGKSLHAASFASPFGFRIEEVADESEMSIVSPIAMIDDEIELRSPVKEEPLAAEPVALAEASAAAEDDEDMDLQIVST